MQGSRKFVLGLVYIFACSLLSGYAISKGYDWAGIASLNASIATGLGVIVWGNVQTHRANGKPKPTTP